MTEEEAKTKWCCGTPAVVFTTINYAAGRTSKEPLKCLGSACMAWRWGVPRQHGEVHMPPPDDYVAATTLNFTPELPERIKQFRKDQLAACRVPEQGATLFLGIALSWRDGETPTGFCGLGGKP